MFNFSAFLKSYQKYILRPEWLSGIDDHYMLWRWKYTDEDSEFNITLSLEYQNSTLNQPAIQVNVQWLDRRGKDHYDQFTNIQHCLTCTASSKLHITTYKKIRPLVLILLNALQDESWKPKMCQSHLDMVLQDDQRQRAIEFLTSFEEKYNARSHTSSNKGYNNLDRALNTLLKVK